MSAYSDNQIGTLLLNLNSLRHPTKLENRLLQIQDEFQILRELTSTQENTELTELTNQLKHQLELSRVTLELAPSKR